ncbi:MAG: AzlC family ABC transporter permease [Anaerolineae bacterium]|nr:AzlC family ABC transporter permease [Anaerolineae bacterium]
MSNPSRRTEFWAGVRDTFPLIVGAIPFGVIFGALGVNSGLSPATTMSMSLFVFAGSAQFIAAGLVAQGISLPFIILTTFVVNLRHALYGATLAPHVRHLSQKWLLPLGFWLTDETFAVVVARYNRSDDSSLYKHWYHLGSSIAMYGNWQLCTLIGLIAGQSLQGIENLGLDFAMIVTFIGLIVPVVKTRPILVSVIVAGAVSILAYPLENKIGLIIAALCGVIAGVIAETYLPQPKTVLDQERAA